jgi:uncharacterized membrane protein
MPPSPTYHHHTTRVERRIQALSDAVLAIAATILAVPLTRIEEAVRLDMYLRGETLEHVLTSEYQMESFAMLFGTFFIVYLVWVRHGRQFHKLAREDAGAALVLSNAVELLLTTTLPFTAASAARSGLGDEDITSDERQKLALPFCANMFALATARVSFEAFALRARTSPGEGFFNLIEASIEVALFLLIFAISSSTNLISGERIFLPFIFVPFLTTLFRTIIINRTVRQLGGGGDDARSLLILQKRDVERLHGFVDGVVAVSSTMMILEIKPPTDCSDLREPESCIAHYAEGCRLDISNKFDWKCVLERGEEQERDFSLIIAYSFGFTLMICLWYVHHCVFEDFFQVSNMRILPLMFNGFFCVSLSVMPFAFALLAEFSVKPLLDNRVPGIIPSIFDFDSLDKRSKHTACVFTLILILISSGTLLLFHFITRLRLDRKFFVNETTNNTTTSNNNSSQNLLLVSVIPCIAFLNLILIFVSDVFLVYPMLLIFPIFVIMFVKTPGKKSVPSTNSIRQQQQQQRPSTGTTSINSNNNNISELEQPFITTGDDGSTILGSFRIINDENSINTGIERQETQETQDDTTPGSVSLFDDNNNIITNENQQNGNEDDVIYQTPISDN